MRAFRQNEAACWRPTASERRPSCVCEPRISRGASRPTSSRSEWGARRAQELERSSMRWRLICRSGHARRWSRRAGPPGFPAAGTSRRGKFSTHRSTRSGRPRWRSWSRRSSETATRYSGRVPTYSTSPIGFEARESRCAFATSAIAARWFWYTASRLSVSAGPLPGLAPEEVPDPSPGGCLGVSPVGGPPSTARHKSASCRRPATPPVPDTHRRHHAAALACLQASPIRGSDDRKGRGGRRLASVRRRLRKSRRATLTRAVPSAPPSRP